jgi:hypothetical protein
MIKITHHETTGSRSGELHVHRPDTGQTFKIHVFRGPNETIQFAFRTPDPSANRIAAPVIDELQRRTPWTVDDLFLRK